MKQADPEELFQEDEEEKERRPITPWVLFAIFLIILAFGIVAVFLFLNPDSPDDPRNL